MTSQNRAAKKPEYLASVNPRGTIPAIEDGNVVLWESHAILIYLCEKHGWTDIWPSDVAERARVNQYLHFHHRNTREIVITWSRALWPAVFDVKNPDAAWYRRNTFPGLQNNTKVVENTLKIIDDILAQSTFIASDYLTIADICAYEELGQNQSKFANCTDYEPYSHVRRWLLQMEEIPFHEEAHQIWTLIGDASKFSGGMQALAQANKTAAKTFQSSNL